MTFHTLTETERRMRRNEWIQDGKWILMLFCASLPVIIVAAFLAAK